MSRAVLLVTPIMPAASGNGLAMRAGLALEALARDDDVHLCVVPVSDPDPVVTPFVAGRAARIHVLDLATGPDAHAALIARVVDPAERMRQRLLYGRPWLARFCTGRAFDALAAWSAAAEYAAVQVNGLHLAPFAEAVAAPVRVLDLNDDEIRTHDNLAVLHERNGEPGQAALARAEARAYRAFAAHWLPRFEIVLTAAAGDAAGLQTQFPAARFAALANGYPERALGRPRRAGAFRILFVGTLGYAPNTDAAAFLCRDILPHLRGAAQVDIAGAGAPPRLRCLGNDPAITLHGRVADLSSLYASATVAAVPVRAGGGTRIKILEAFAHGVPVVATTLGAEGLELTPGRDFLCADTAEDFAAACRRLADDSALAARLGDAGAALLRQRYAAINVQHALRRIHATLAASRT